VPATPVVLMIEKFNSEPVPIIGLKLESGKKDNDVCDSEYCTIVRDIFVSKLIMDGL
jgi:hypothetical protein